MPEQLPHDPMSMPGSPCRRCGVRYNPTTAYLPCFVGGDTLTTWVARHAETLVAAKGQVPPLLVKMAEKHLPDEAPDDEPAPRPPGWTVGRLRAALAGLPDAMEIVVYATSEHHEDHDDQVCGGIYHASQQESHADDTVFLGLHASDASEDFESDDRGDP